MEVCRPRGIGARRHQRDVGPGEGLQRLPDALEGDVARGPDDLRVEGGIGDRDGVPVAGEGGPAHLLAMRRQLLDVPVGDQGHRQAGAESLEDRPDGIRLEQLLGRGPADPRPAERQDLDDAEGLEALERLAHRRLAGPKLARDPRLDDPGVRRVPAGEDGLQQMVLDLLREDAPRDGGLGGHRDSCQPAWLNSGSADRLRRDHLPSGFVVYRGATPRWPSGPSWRGARPGLALTTLHEPSAFVATR